MNLPLKLAPLALISSLVPAQGLGSDVWFRDAAAETGLVFHHFTGATGQFYMPEIMGAGGAVLDYDRDGDLDVYLLQGQVLQAGKRVGETLFPPAPGFRPGHRLFRNELVPGGRLRFTDVTEKAGLVRDGYGMGAAVGDYDNDGDPDLYVTHFGPNVLYRNNSDGTFTDVTAAAGVDDPRWSTSSSFLDYDRDGDLDLFVANYVDFTVKGNKRCLAPTGEVDYCTPAIYSPAPDRLFRNEGNGRFTDVTETAGIAVADGPGLGVCCTDFNGDGWIDIYVANDGTANLLWINRRDGTFEESGLLSGTAYNEHGSAEAGMGLAAGDFDGDGDEDILVTNLTQEGSTLYQNEGDGDFSDASRKVGLKEPSFGSTGFGVNWFDYDNDGNLDLFAANGAVTLLPLQRGSPYPFSQRNQLFRNEGNGRFREVTELAGKAFDLMEVSRAAAFGDLDNDGDTDIVVTNNNGPVRLLLNNLGSQRQWLRVQLEAEKGNREGIGAKVILRQKSGKTLLRCVRRDGSYLAASDPRLLFGLGDDGQIESVEVLWPGGLSEKWTEIGRDRELILKQGTGTSTESHTQRTSSR